MEQNLTFLPLLLVLLLAFIVPLVLSRIRWIPVVVGEILAGILIGRSVFNLIRSDPTLDFLAEVGLALLMFLSGLEIDFSILTQAARTHQRRARPILLAILSFVFTVLLAGLLGLFLMKRGVARDPWMLALILSTTSLGIVVPVLKERAISASPFGQTLILSALLADFLTMFLITVYVAIMAHGLSLKILLVCILFVIALLTYRIGLIRIQRPRMNKVMAEISHATSQIKVYGAIAILLAFVVLAKFLGTEMILGAFLAGVVLSLLSQPADEQTRHRLDAIGFGFFIPIFFISVGIQFDFPSLLRNKVTWLMTPLFLAGAFGIKLIPALIFRTSFSWRKTLAGGILLSSRLSLIIAASGVGLRLGVIDEAANAAFILVAAFTSTLAPLVFNWILPMREGKKEHPVLIFGFNDVGLQVARELEKRGEKFIFLKQHDPSLRMTHPKGYRVIPAEGLTFPQQGLDISTIRGLIALDADDSRNMAICQEALSLGLKHIIAMVNDPAKIPIFQELGIQTFTPVRFRATLLALMASNPNLFSLLTSTREDHQIREIFLNNPEVVGKLLQDLRLGGDVLVLSIRRGGELLVPHGHTRLELDDHLTVLGSVDSLEDLVQLMEK